MLFDQDTCGGGGWVTAFVDSISIQIVPRILPNCTYTLWGMIRLIVTCGNRVSITYRLLGMYLVGNFLWVCEDVI